MDVEKHVRYWQNSADEDWRAAMSLLDEGHYRHGLFFVHLSIEKKLKAAYVAANFAPAPRSHDLQRLAREAGLQIDEGRAFNLARVNRYCMEGRYPDDWALSLSKAEAAEISAVAEEMAEWLTHR
jgi:HEPN domain-containing protein